MKIFITQQKIAKTKHYYTFQMFLLAKNKINNVIAEQILECNLKLLIKKLHYTIFNCHFKKFK